jgi:hypothetical protein
MSSVLADTKKVLGLAENDTVYDADIIMHINSVFSMLNQLGLGPAEGFQVIDETQEWSGLLGEDIRLNSAKTYVYLRVRLLFDPPTTSFLINALENQYQEIEWRLSTQRESAAWINPLPEPVEDTVYDGGEP